MQSISLEATTKHCSTRCSAPTVKQRVLSCTSSSTHRLLTVAHVYRKPATGEWNTLDSTNKSAVSRPPNARIPPPPHCSQYSAGKLAFLGDGIWTVRATSQGCFCSRTSVFQLSTVHGKQTDYICKACMHQNVEISSR